MWRDFGPAGPFSSLDQLTSQELKNENLVQNSRAKKFGVFMDTIAERHVSSDGPTKL